MHRKLLSLLALCLLLLLVGCHRSDKPVDSSDTETSPPGSDVTEDVFQEVQVITENPVAYEKVELALYEETPTIKEEGNPYDYEYLSVMGIFTSPSGKTYEIPAFWYRDYDIHLDTNWTNPPTGISGIASTDEKEPQGLEVVTWKGDEHYRLRFLPEEAGTWKYAINVNKEGQLVQKFTGQVDIKQNSKTYRGRIQVEPTHRRNFIFEDGTTFIPIGQNTAWYTSSTRKTYDYDVWFSKMNENGANFARIWMATWGFSLHWGNRFDDFSSRMAQAARLDRVIELAEQYDIYIMLTLLNHGQFSAQVNAEWDRNPWNEKNGGILKDPMQFFYKKQAKDIYKSQLLYIIGRYGYSDHVMAWELWNEVNWVDGYSRTPDGYVWHQEISQFVKDHDPYERLVTTSFNGETNNAYNIKTIDYTNPHSYGYNGRNFNTTLPEKLEWIWSLYQKPVLHSEIGINWENGIATTQADPTGISLHQQNWAGMMGGGAGGAMNWWWDSWVHPNDLYYRFKGASTYAKEMDMVGETYQQLHLDSSIEISDPRVGILGYQIDERLYGYFFDRNWKHNTPNVHNKENVRVEIPFIDGNYTLRIFDTVTGEVIRKENVNVTNQTFIYTFDTITTDLAIILD